MNPRCTATAQYRWTGEFTPTPFQCEYQNGHDGDHHQTTPGGSMTWPNVQHGQVA